MKKVFICVRDAFVIKLNHGDFVEQPSAIYYSNNIGRRRNYRQKFPIPDSVGMRLKTFKIKKNAQDLADYTNKAYSDNFKVIEVTEEFAKQCKQIYIRGEQ